jgi:endonuclease/exonuclease/phosphatase family metal-dependent hydrolase
MDLVGIVAAPCKYRLTFPASRSHMKSMEHYARPLRVASYNIRKCIGLDRQRRPERTIDVIAALQADIVALQEVDRRLGNRPATLDRCEIARCTDLEPLEVAANDVSLGWHGNAILTRKGSQVSDFLRLELPGLEPRGAILAELVIAAGPMRIVAAHLGLTRKMRRAQLATIAQQIRGRAPMPTLVLGDFNEWSNDRGLEPLQPDYRVHAPGRSFHAARPVAALDRIAANDGFELVDAGVAETPDSRRASDHLPVWADFQIT